MWCHRYVQFKTPCSSRPSRRGRVLASAEGIEAKIPFAAYVRPEDALPYFQRSCRRAGHLMPVPLDEPGSHCDCCT